MQNKTISTTFSEDTRTGMFFLPNSNYVSYGFMQAGNIQRPISNSATLAVFTFKLPEPDIIPFDACQSSGVLDFWNDPGEDIYNFEDGEPV